MNQAAPTSNPTHGESALMLDNQLCFALYAASRAMIVAYRPLLERLELTYPQYLVMLVLWEQDGLRITELGERLHLDTGTLTPLLKRMETAGLVTRRRRASDEREVEIQLTPAGRALKQLARKVPEQILSRAGLALSEVVALREDLKQLLQHLSTPTPGETT